MDAATKQSRDQISSSLARTLVLDELFDLTLYRNLHKSSKGRLGETLAELIQIETQHLAFWQDFFHLPLHELDRRRRVKMWVLNSTCRLFGETAVHLTLDAIEVYGIRKYLALWESYGDAPLGRAVRSILDDELKHEDLIVSRITERRINPERIRSIFFGLNDGLVEILGAVSGFFAAFHDPGTVLIASATGTVAGAVSMAAGAFVAAGSEAEVRRLEQGKARFVKGATSMPDERENILGTAFLVGVSYVIGAIVPVLPVVFGARSVLASGLAAAAAIVLVSSTLAFLSGMRIGRRIATNLSILAAAVAVAYLVGRAARSLWGVSI